jgi:hypothetical protein
MNMEHAFFLDLSILLLIHDMILHYYVKVKQYNDIIQF